MIILVLNCGSSSVKYKLFDVDSTDTACLAEGKVERVAVAPSGEQELEYKSKSGASLKRKVAGATHREAVGCVFEVLTDKEIGVLKDVHEIQAVGHRVVHGGEKIADPVLVDDEVIGIIEECALLAPLHNPGNLAGLHAAMELLPGVPQAAIFDTAFHARMPEHAWRYAIPDEYYEELAIRRYGFHGTSHRYVSLKAQEILSEAGIPPEEARIITVHLGNGASIAAIKGGISVDTSMGTTPVEGLIMGTRSGDLDPAIIPFIELKKGLKPEEIDHMLNKKSGLLALSKGYTDMRDIMERMEAGDERCKLAFEMFCYRVRKYVGAYAAVLEGVDAVVFTGGIGENSPEVRTQVCKGLEFMGLELDEALNAKRGQIEVSKPGSKGKLLVIPTNEELMIALDTKALIEKSAHAPAPAT